MESSKPRRTPGALASDHETRFLDGLVRYAEKGVTRFHTPGHRGGRWIDPSLAVALGAPALSLDVSDVLEGVADSPGWTDALRHAQHMTAELFGASGSRYLVNGTSGGIHAAVMSLAAGKEVLCSRASHLSVFAACMLHRCALRTLPPDYDEEWDIPGPPAPQHVREALAAFRPALFIETHPNYFGIAPDLAAVTPHLGGTFLLVDEAHGSHFRFCPQAPRPALDSGAHVVVQSFHKTLGALTQASVLHVGARHSYLLPLVDRSLFLLQTTSPSPFLLASLEAATAQALRSAEQDWAYAAALAAYFRREVAEKAGCRTLSAQGVRERWGGALDPARVVVNVADIGWRGNEAAAWLRREGNIQVEMANGRCLVFLISPGNTEAEVDAAVASLQAMRDAREGRSEPGASLPPPQPAAAMPPWEALEAPCTWVPLAASKGRVSAEIICPYPPGIPAVLPGEVIDGAVVEYLERVVETGGELRGAAFPDLRRIGVVA